MPVTDAAFQPAVDAVLERYDLHVTSMTPARLVNNAVFRLETSDGDVALRIHRPGYRTASQTRSELAFMTALGEGAAVAVPDVVPTSDGESVAEIDIGGPTFHASVLGWVDGDVKRPGAGAGEATLERMGSLLATMHEFGSSWDTPRGFDLPRLDTRTLLDREVESDSVRRLVDEVRRIVDERFVDVERTPETWGLIHHDFVFGNVLHDGWTPVVIDFDDCGWGYHLQDVGAMLENLSDGTATPALHRAFVEGYESVRPFPVTDERDEQVVVALRHAVAALFLLEREEALGDRFATAMEYRVISLGTLLADIA